MNTFRFDHPQHSSPRSHGLRNGLAALAFVAAFAFSACAAAAGPYHKYFMRGQVLELDGNSLTICIGDKDGAEIGQVLQVIRHVAQSGGSPKAGGHKFTREAVGTVRITTVFDEHYATAEVVDGKPNVHDTVELERD